MNYLNGEVLKETEIIEIFIINLNKISYSQVKLVGIKSKALK